MRSSKFYLKHKPNVVWREFGGGGAKYDVWEQTHDDRFFYSPLPAETSRKLFLIEIFQSSLFEYWCHTLSSFSSYSVPEPLSQFQPNLTRHGVYVYFLQ